MAVNLLHKYLLDASPLDDTSVLKAAVAHLVPSPAPPDLLITVGPGRSLAIQFTLTHANADDAATAAICTMKGLPTP